jgi:hypothetical protein
MNANTKNWLCHCDLPHNGHDLNVQMHDMVHDQKFWNTVMITFAAFVVIMMMCMSFILGPSEGATTTDFRHYDMMYYNIR